MTAGYSGTPLAKKLSLKDGMRVWFLDMPDSVRSEIEGSDLTLSEDEVPAPGLHAAHIFVTDRDTMKQHLATLREMIDPAGQVWVSWPKKASKVDTDITEDTIREVALPMGLVDIKVCAVDAVWSGLKLVIRKELR
ncbi:DUF3052 family protein [Parasphingorhabdus flavimaris]|uniref:DUF3052 family protein n=1 Tax=Parasphingorhabdus flavimaris TaxID=266812 RepID=A0ABX2N697_9SPHN|nr:DUF3052 family protein [Parasphingorhabdus flavimaris]NVD29253.1 DUF3052 family protein [Parasphingorhabdus flavimaris]